MKFLNVIFGSLLLLPIKAEVQQQKIKIAVIDSGLTFEPRSMPLCDESFNSTSESLFEDKLGHGTAIVKLIENEIGPSVPHCYIIIKVFSKYGVASPIDVAQALKYARESGANIINMSLNGLSYSGTEEKEVVAALDAGIKLVMASGNDGLNLDIKCISFPACYDSRAIVVASYDDTANKGSIVDYIVDGHAVVNGVYKKGTSISAARLTGKIVNNDMEDL